MAQILTAQSVTRLGRNEIQAQLARCPSLPSLGSINKALQGLLLTEQRYTVQIAEIIRRDPSLTARLLRLVNSVYFRADHPGQQHRGSGVLISACGRSGNWLWSRR